MTIKESLENIGSWPFIRVSNRRGEVIVDMEKYADQIRKVATRQAYEEAARICDEQAGEPECPERAQYCADAIRAKLLVLERII